MGRETSLTSLVLLQKADESVPNNDFLCMLQGLVFEMSVFIFAVFRAASVCMS